MYIYIKLNHCAVYLKVTQYYKSTILQLNKVLKDKIKRNYLEIKITSKSCITFKKSIVGF